MSSSDSDYINILNNAGINIVKYALPVFYVITNLGTLVSIFVFSRKSWRKNVCVFYFKIFLLYTLGLMNISTIGGILNQGYENNLQNSNIFLCKMYLYLTFLFGTLAPTVLILASIDRLLISSQNIDTRFYSSRRLAYFSIGLSTTFWIIFYSHVLIKVNIQELYPTVFICYFDLSAVYLNFVAYSSGTIDVIFSVSMIVLCIFAFKNVRRIRAVPREKRHQLRAMTKKDFQLLRCLFAQDVVFLIFVTPSTVSYMYNTITNGQIQTPLQQAINNFVENVLSLLYNMSYALNFFIFFIVSKAFRHELRRITYKIIGKDVVPMREEENRQDNIGRDNAQVNVVSIIELPA